MPHSCKICNRDDRAEIEQALMTMTSSAPFGKSLSIEDVANMFECDVEELKTHAMFHGLAAAVQEDAASRDSLARKIKLREADILADVSNEYLITLKTLGRRVNKLAGVSAIDVEDEDKQIKLAKLLTKPVVDLYLGLGSEIRQTVKVMAELENMLNGDKDSSFGGLKALAAAIKGSAGDTCD